MDIAHERRIEAFLQALTGVPWFSDAGRPSETYHVAADAVVAWDDWNAALLEVWVTRSERLEARAQRAVGDAAIDTTFTGVSEALESTVKAGVKAYFARRPDETENTEVGADLGLWPDIVDRVLRDVSWAAIETALEEPDFFVSLLPIYQEGRWPCSWEGKYPNGRFVVL